MKKLLLLVAMVGCHRSRTFYAMQVAPGSTTTVICTKWNGRNAPTNCSPLPFEVRKGDHLAFWIPRKVKP